MTLGLDQRHRTLCVVDRRPDLPLVAHDAGVIEKTGDIVVVVVRHDTEVEAVEGGPKVLSLAQDRDPGEAGLEPSRQSFSKSRTSSTTGRPHSWSWYSL